MNISKMESLVVVRAKLLFFPKLKQFQHVSNCAVAENCNGYTWHGKSSTRLNNTCVLFFTFRNKHKCADCISGDVERVIKLK